MQEKSLACEQFPTKLFVGCIKRPDILMLPSKGDTWNIGEYYGVLLHIAAFFLLKNSTAICRVLRTSPELRCRRAGTRSLSPGMESVGNSCELCWDCSRTNRWFRNWRRGRPMETGPR